MLGEYLLHHTPELAQSVVDYIADNEPHPYSLNTKKRWRHTKAERRFTWGNSR